MRLSRKTIFIVLGCAALLPLSYLGIKALTQSGEQGKNQVVSQTEIKEELTTSPNLSVTPVKNLAPDKDLEIEIAGEKISFTTHTLELNEYSLPDKPVDYLYEKLSEKALNGDIVASRLLAQLLRRCSESYATISDHEEALSRLIEHGEFPSANAKFSGTKVDQELIPKIADEFQSEYSYCEALSIEKRKESTKWAKIAAEGGDFIGIEMLLSDSSVSGAQKLELLNTQWTEHGSLNGALGMASVLSGLSNFGEYKGVEPDPQLAYTYFLISSNANVAIHQNSQPLLAATLNSEYVEFASILTARLSPREHLEAEQLAVQLMRENTNCCAIDERQSFLVSARGDK